MGVPVVAIVGRPNVGKSSLFNWLAQRKIAIVDPTAGVTRDRVSTLIKLGERFVELTDTGGLGVQDAQGLTREIEHQIDLALDRAAVILFVVDGRAGLTPLDEQVAERLRQVARPILLVANKCDVEALDASTAEFYRLGPSKLICVSAQQNRNRDQLLQLIEQRLPAPEADETVEQEVAMKLAIVGRRNTGKSTFINALAEEERMIVSEVAGTTRDSVDVRFERDGLTFIAIDTAGVRRKKSLADDIEWYSMHRAERSIRRADVVLHFLDATQTISKVDKQLAEYVLENHKPVIFVVNKWDLLKDRVRTGEMGDYIRATFPSLDYVPIAFVTAKTGKNARVLLNLAQNLFKQAQARVTTGDLNRVIRAALEAQSPPLRQNRRAKVYYATQVSTAPPTVVLFTNGPELFDDSYVRYLLRCLRDSLPFRDIPIRLHLRKRGQSDATPGEGVIQSPTKESEAREMPQRRKRVKAEPPRKDSKRQESELWDDL